MSTQESPHHHPADCIGKRITAIRQAEKMSQSQLAKALRISQPYLSLLESGAKNPSETLLELIICRFGIRREWLYEGKGRPLVQEDKEGAPQPKKLSRREMLERDLLITACVLGPILPMVSGTMAIGVGASHILSKMCKAYKVASAAALAKKLGVDRTMIKYWIKKEKVPEKYLQKTFEETELSAEDIKESEDLLIISKSALAQKLKEFLHSNFAISVEIRALEPVIEDSRYLENL